MAFSYHGNWGGPGWSDGHYTYPGEPINWGGAYTDRIDQVFRDHDHAYNNAINTYNNSDKSEPYRIQFWGSIIAADQACIDQIRAVTVSGTETAAVNAKGYAASDAFTHKQWAYNIPSLAGKIDPDVGLAGTAIDGITGMRIPGMIGISINILVTAALNWVPPRRDPLVLDLDGSGITTSAIFPAAPILFDHDGDGTKTATGWIAAGEAIVVRDLNGNGTIDSGRELFGDNTILTRGARAGQVAANGFEALADLDMDINGVADGKFDAADAAFASVKLWRDQNQDGISQSSELFTFAQLDVASINTTGTADNVNLGGDNTQTHAGTFTRTTGATGEAGTAHLAASLLLANNNFYRQFSDDPALSAEAQALPQMQGSGTVRDLRPAMSLGTPQAAALQTALTQYAADTTRDAQLGHLDALIQSWGATSAMQTSAQTNRVIANYGGPNVIDTYGATAIERYALDNPAMYAKITALEQFNEEGAAKNIAGCAHSRWANGRFGLVCTKRRDKRGALLFRSRSRIAFAHVKQRLGLHPQRTCKHLNRIQRGIALTTLNPAHV
jgi:hypothetical protein